MHDTFLVRTFSCDYIPEVRKRSQRVERVFLFICTFFRCCCIVHICWIWRMLVLHRNRTFYVLMVQGGQRLVGNHQHRNPFWSSFPVMWSNLFNLAVHDERTVQYRNPNPIDVNRVRDELLLDHYWVLCGTRTIRSSLKSVPLDTNNMSPSQQVSWPVHDCPLHQNEW